MSVNNYTFEGGPTSTEKQSCFVEKFGKGVTNI